MLSSLPLLGLSLATVATSWMAYRSWTEDESAPDWRARMQAVGRKVIGSGDRAQLQSRLTAAGLRDAEAVDLFYALQLLSIICGLGTGLLAASLLARTPQIVLLLGFAGFAIGYLLPLRILDARAEARRNKISRALPAAVDLLVNTIEAGLSIEQSFARLAQVTSETTPALGDELSVTVREVAAGMPFTEAVRRLGRRVGVEELQSLAAVIAQASALGGRIGQSLRDYADAARKKRMSLMEERAGKLSARLTFPIVVCLVPAAILVMIAPAIVEAIKVFKN